MTDKILSGLEISRRHFLTGVAGAVAVSAIGVSGSAFAQSGEQLKFALSSFPANMRPFENLGTSAATVRQQMHRGLLSFDSEGELRAEVAEDWEQRDASTYAFTLRENVVFHDGSPVTAEDVKGTFEAIKETAGAYHAQDFAIIEEIAIEEPRTVVFKLSAPSATFPLMCASFNAPIVKVSSLAENPEDPVGCGPFVLTGSERGAWIEMDAFPDYYKDGLPGAAKLRFETMADDNARLAALMSGGVHLIEYAPAFEMDAIEANPDFVLDAVEGPSTYLLFNVEKGPFADARVRQAVGYAINRDEVAEGAFGGRASGLTGLPIPTASPFYSDNEEVKWSYDPDKARELLTEAGFPNGFDCTLVTYNSSVHQNPAMVAQQHLAAVGINAQLNVVDWPTRIQVGNQGQYDIGVMANSGDSNDPDALKLMLQGDLGPSFYRSHGYNNAEINELLSQGRQETEQAARKAIYDRIQEISKEDPAIIPLCWRDQAYAWTKKVDGFANLPGFLTFYSGIMLEEVRFV